MQKRNCPVFCIDRSLSMRLRLVCGIAFWGPSGTQRQDRCLVTNATNSRPICLSTHNKWLGV
jgi:hypothetical protein